MNTVFEHINSSGTWFVDFAAPMLLQSTVLVIILLLVDLLLRKKVRAVFRYCMWMLILAKLILPSSLSSPVGIGNWLGYGLPDIPAAKSPVVDNHLVNENLPFVPNAETAQKTSVVKPAFDVSPARSDTASQTQPAKIAATLTWQGGVFLFWLAVAAAMGLLLLQRAVFVCGLIRQAKEANNLMNDTLRFCCGQMGIKRTPSLKVSANATSPAVCGLFRPVILIPENLGSDFGVAGLRAVLLHELAHIKRFDLWVNLLQTILQIIYFYNPFVWLANWIIRRVREQAVDEMVLVTMGEKAQQYPETLINVARLAFKRPALSLRLIGVVESKSALAQRIKHILNRPIPKSAKLGILGLAVILIFAAVLLPMAQAVPLPEFVIKGTVTDTQTGKPIANAKVGDEKYAGNTQFTYTDANGNYSYKTWYEEHGIKADADGYKRQDKGFGTKLFGREKEKNINFELTADSNKPQSATEKIQSKKGDIELLKIIADGYETSWKKIRTWGGAAAIDYSVTNGKKDQSHQTGWIRHSQAEFLLDRDLDATRWNVHIENITFDADIQQQKSLFDYSGMLKDGQGYQMVYNRQDQKMGRTLEKLPPDQILRTEGSFAFDPIYILQHIYPDIPGMMRFYYKDANNPNVAYTVIREGNIVKFESKVPTDVPSQPCVNRLVFDLSKGCNLIEFEGISPITDGRWLVDYEQVGDVFVIKSMSYSHTDKRPGYESRSQFNVVFDNKMVNKPIAPYEFEFDRIGFRDRILDRTVDSNKPTLPMVKREGQATSDERRTTGGFTATLPNGVTVELVGVSNYPDNNICWRPDGSKSEQKLFAGVGVEKRNRQDNFGFVVRFDGPNDISISYGPVLGGRGYSGIDRVVDVNGKEVKGYNALTVLITDAGDSTSIKFGVAAGSWETLASDSGKHGTTTGGKMIIFSQAFETKDGIAITVSSKSDKSRAKRIVAMDKNNRLYTSRGRNQFVSNDLDQLTAEFSGLKLEDIARFDFQTRPYEWVEFKNVSLKPNVKTDVQIEVEKNIATEATENTENLVNNQSSAGQGKRKNSSDSLPNLFILSPPSDVGPGLHIFEEITYVLKNAVHNKTGRNHDKESYDGLFNGTHNRKPGDLLVLVFSLDTRDRTPAEYQDLLPQPWDKIEAMLKQGQTVELQGKSRDFNVIVLAAPTFYQLEGLIKSTKLLEPFKTPASQPETKTD